MCGLRLIHVSKRGPGDVIPDKASLARAGGVLQQISKRLCVVTVANKIHAITALKKVFLTRLAIQAWIQRCYPAAPGPSAPLLTHWRYRNWSKRLIKIIDEFLHTDEFLYTSPEIDPQYPVTKYDTGPFADLCKFAVLRYIPYLTIEEALIPKNTLFTLGHFGLRVCRSLRLSARASVRYMRWPVHQPWACPRDNLWPIPARITKLGPEV